MPPDVPFEAIESQTLSVRDTVVEITLDLGCAAVELFPLLRFCSDIWVAVALGEVASAVHLVVRQNLVLGNEAAWDPYSPLQVARTAEAGYGFDKR